MSSVQLHPWGLAYLAVALLFGVAALVVADHLRSGEAPSAAVRGTAAVVAGALWPVMVVGLTQLLILRTVTDRLRMRPTRHAAEATSRPVGGLAGAH
jgi:hypothetical protein